MYRINPNNTLEWTYNPDSPYNRLLKTWSWLAFSRTHEQMEKIMTSSNIELHPDALHFLLWSRLIKSQRDLHKQLAECGELTDVQRFILYRPINENEMEIIMIFSSDEDEEAHVGNIVKIEQNPNLENAVRNKQLSQIPVEGIWEDIAFPIGEQGLVMAMDNTDSARIFTGGEIMLLELIAANVASAYTAGISIHGTWQDHLTGLWNRFALDRAINEGKDIFGNTIPEIQTVAFFDFDDFKSINETFDHAIGDAALRHVARILKEGVERVGGTLTRYGWDEFAAIFPNTPTLAEIDIIRLTLANTPFKFNFNGEGREHTITTSIGYCDICDVAEATVEKWSTPIRTAIKFADHAVGLSKTAGKNRVTQWTEGAMSTPKNESLIIVKNIGMIFREIVENRHLR